MLQVKIEEFNENIILRCVGRIVRGHETELLCAAVRQYGRNITVDLREVSAIDAAGVGALVALQAAGVYLRLANPTPAVREVLRLTKLDSIFEICTMPLTETYGEASEAMRDKRVCGHLLTPVTAAS